MRTRRSKIGSWRVLAQSNNCSDDIRKRDQTNVVQILRRAMARPAISDLRVLCSDHQQVSRTSDHETINSIANLIVSGHLVLSNDGMIQAQQLKRIFPKGNMNYLRQVANELNTDLPTYGLDSTLRKVHFFGQLREESGDSLNRPEESLNYTPAALRQTFSYYQHHPSEADQDARTSQHSADQQAVANKVYASRLGNGSVTSGDGWRFRGRGLIQITGRVNYAAASLQYGKLYEDGVDFETTPDLVSHFPYSVRSAICFWIQHGLEKLADRGNTIEDVDRITEVVNANTDSYEERERYFRTAYDAFRQA